MKKLFLITMFLAPIFSNGSKKAVFKNSETLNFTHHTVTVKPSIFPRLRYADSIINNSPTNQNSIAWRLKNPGNLRNFRNSDFKKFDTLKEGYEALISQLDLYLTGRSMWTDSTTTLSQYTAIYAESSFSGVYTAFLSKKLHCQPSTKIADLNADSLAKYHIQMEDKDLFKIMYQ